MCGELFDGLEDGPVQSAPMYIPPLDGAKKQANVAVVVVILYILSVVALTLLYGLSPGNFGDVLRGSVDVRYDRRCHEAFDLQLLH